MSNAQGFLAAQHRALVNEFIDAVVSAVPVDLAIEGRNALGLSVRGHVENGLVPGVIAAVALLLGAPHGALERDLPQWIERVSTLMPEEAAFLTEAGRRVSPAEYELLAENVGLSQGQCLAVEVYRSCLLAMAPCVPRTAITRQ